MSLEVGYRGSMWDMKDIGHIIFLELVAYLILKATGNRTYPISPMQKLFNTHTVFNSGNVSLERQIYVHVFPSWFSTPE